jgi:hypothetical protein
MYLFSITINIEDSVQEEWMKWVNTKVKPIISDKNLVYDFRVLRIISEEPNNGSSYSFQYHLHDEEGIEVFEERYDREVAADMYRFYKEKFVEFRTRLEVVEWEL